jgi:hypothetical protein
VAGRVVLLALYSLPLTSLAGHVVQGTALPLLLLLMSYALPLAWCRPGTSFKVRHDRCC